MEDIEKIFFGKFLMVNGDIITCLSLGNGTINDFQKFKKLSPIKSKHEVYVMSEEPIKINGGL